MSCHFRFLLPMLLTLGLAVSTFGCAGGGAPSAPSAPGPDTEYKIGEDYAFELDERDLAQEGDVCFNAWARRATGRNRTFFGPTFFVIGNSAATTERNLYARNTADQVGTLTVVHDGEGTLTVTYDVFEEVGLNQANLFVGELPPFFTGPRDFPYRATDLDGAQSHTFTIDLNADFPDAGFLLFISGHARVCEDGEPPCPDLEITGELSDPALNTPYEAALGVSGGTGPFSFALATGELPAGLTLSAEGLVSGTVIDETLVGTEFTFTVSATDEAAPTCPVTRDFTITVQDEVGPCPEASITGELADPELNVEYSGALAVENGIGTYSFSTDGSLPTGLTLNADGTVSGTATDETQVGGAFTFTVTGSSDARPDCPVLREFTITLQPEPPDPCPEARITGELADPELNTEYSGALAVEDGVGTYSFATDGALPTGLTLNADGTVTGTATDETQVGSPFTFTVIATSDERPDCPVAREFTITLQPDPPDPCPEASIVGELADPQLAIEYVGALSVENGVGTYSFATDGALPSGLTLNADGSVTGTPDDETQVGAPFTFTVTASSDERPDCPVLREFTITLQPTPCAAAPEIGTTELPGATIGELYEATVSATGGEGTLVFSIGDNPLPDGLTLDAATGLISGIPSNPEQQCSTMTFTITVTDSCREPQSDSVELSIAVDAPPCDELSMSSKGFFNPRFGEEYSALFIGNGGSEPYAWSIASGVLPSGLELNAETGVLSGTPDDESQIGQKFSFTIRLTDDCQCENQFVEESVTMVVQPPRP